jgi:hypothetical protein
MNLRLAMPKALVFAGWLATFCLGTTMAKAQSEQSILYSTPDGRSVSNALLPTATAPGTPAELPDVPDNAQSSFQFNAPQPQAGMPLPQLMPNSRKKSEDDMDVRKRMGMQTPAEVMGVPSMRELFGLPQLKNTNSMAQPDGTMATNSITAANDANWAKILSADSDAFGSAKTTSSNNLSGDFFDSADSDRLPREKKADDQNGNDDSDTSSFTQAGDRQPVWDSAVQIATPGNIPGYNPNAAPPAPAFSAAPAQDSQSPFALPKVSSVETTMPQLPTLPSISRPNPPSQPAVPSWAPKPPPWLDPTPPLGTMAQRKF